MRKFLLLMGLSGVLVASEVSLEKDALGKDSESLQDTKALLEGALISPVRRSVFLFSALVTEYEFAPGILFRSRKGGEGYDFSFIPFIANRGGEVLLSYNLYKDAKYVQPYISFGGGLSVFDGGANMRALFPIAVGLNSRYFFADLTLLVFALGREVQSEIGPHNSFRAGLGLQF